MKFYDCMDFEAAEIVPQEPILRNCPNRADFHFAYNAGREPHAVIFQNQSQGVQIAYSEKEYSKVTWGDVTTLSFTTNLLDTPFAKVAILRTATGSFYKIGPVREDSQYVTFRWEQLRP